MMKKMTLILAMILSLDTFAAYNPISIKGQGDASKVTVTNLQVPNTLATKTAPSTYLIESGNKNILSNPSWESSTFEQGWTVTNSGVVSTAEETTNVIDGTKSYKLSPSSASFELYQDSTLYASQLADGVQGLAMVRVKTTVSGLKVCSRQAGTTSTSNCVDVSSAGTWGLYKVPFVLGGTSNGISLHSDGATVTGDVYVDDAFVGAVDLKQDLSVIGSWTDFTPTGGWTGANVTYTGKYRQVGQNLEIQYAISLLGAPTGTNLTVEMPSGYTIDTSKLAQSNSLSGLLGSGDGFDNAGVSAQLYATYSDTNTIRVQTSTASGTYTTGTLVTNTIPWSWGSGDYLSFTISVPVVELSGSTSIYSSTNNNTDWQSCGHTTSDFTAFGTVTNIETQCKRQGSDLLIKGKFTGGTSTATEARLALKFQGQSLTSANTSFIPSVQMAGSATYSAAASLAAYTLIEPSVGYMTFGLQSGTNAGLTKANGSTILGTGNTLTINARIPISGWDNSNVIVGSFKEVPVVPGMTSPKVVKFMFGGAGSITAPTVCTANPCTEYYDPAGVVSTSPSWASTGASQIVFAAGTWGASTPLDCRCSSYDTTSGNDVECSPYYNGNQTIATDASGGATVAVLSRLRSTGVARNSYFFVTCEGQAP